MSKVSAEKSFPNNMFQAIRRRYPHRATAGRNLSGPRIYTVPPTWFLPRCRLFWFTWKDRQRSPAADEVPSCEKMLLICVPMVTMSTLV